uniref:Uncharacterized protein n=1 Tax=Desulfovibrio sp. U5L TaxID=596152 RepID=I2Q019_9BACT
MAWGSTEYDLLRQKYANQTQVANAEATKANAAMQGIEQQPGMQAAQDQAAMDRARLAANNQSMIADMNNQSAQDIANSKDQAQRDIAALQDQGANYRTGLSTSTQSSIADGQLGLEGAKAAAEDQTRRYALTKPSTVWNEQTGERGSQPGVNFSQPPDIGTSPLDRFRNLPRYRDGGPAVAGRPIIVGDGGKPEVFVPKTDGVVLPDANAIRNARSRLDVMIPREGSAVDAHLARAGVSDYSPPRSRPQPAVQAGGDTENFDYVGLARKFSDPKTPAEWKQTALASLRPDQRELVRNSMEVNPQIDAVLAKADAARKSAPSMREVAANNIGQTWDFLTGGKRDAAQQESGDGYKPNVGERIRASLAPAVDQAAESVRNSVYPGERSNEASPEWADMRQAVRSRLNTGASQAPETSGDTMPVGMVDDLDNESLAYRIGRGVRAALGK